MPAPVSPDDPHDADGLDDLDDLVALAADAARAAGALLLEGVPRARADVATKTSATDMVTEMDRAAEDLIVGMVRERRPGDGILAEEGSAREGTSGVRWVIDPLDGTTNYLYGLPAFAVSIAAEVDGVTVAGAVHDPSHDQLYVAARGRGATCDGEPLRVPGPTAAASLAEALVGTGFAYSPERRAFQGRVAAAVLPRVRDLRRLGAASLDLCWVAAGRLDAYYERTLQPWDIAAGVLVAAEAGAWVGNLDGGPASAEHTIAAAPHLAGPLCDLLREAER